MKANAYSVKHTQPNWKTLPNGAKESKIQVDILKGNS